MTFRAFISVDVGPVPGLVELAKELESMDAALNPVDPQNLHVTLKFLGDVPEGRTDDILETMRLAAQEVEPFTCRLQGVGAFPDEEFIKVVWAGFEGAEPMTRVAEELEEGLAHIRKEDHDFTPHVTLARMTGGHGKARVQAFLDDHRHDELGTVEVPEIRLKQSDLRPEGPVYSTVEQVPLG